MKYSGEKYGRNEYWFDEACMKREEGKQTRDFKRIKRKRLYIMVLPIMGNNSLKQY
jgi:hypothetical protein